MITINKLLDTVLRDFQDYVESQDRLCGLLEMHYDAGRLPDYNDIHNQQLYLLRYAYAYAFEYKRMYATLFDSIGYPKKIKVTSIGCGNLIDYWALAHVVGEECIIYYRGIDSVKWEYEIEKRVNDDLQVLHENAVALFQKTSNLSADIYMFPKSISEFSDEEIQTIADCFVTKLKGKKTVHLMFSLRKDSGNFISDFNRTRIIYNSFIRQGFHSKQSAEQTYYFEDPIKDQKISSVDNDFRHPWETVNYVTQLFLECSNFSNCIYQEQCKQKLGRWPILNCSYATWQTFSFER